MILTVFLSINIISYFDRKSNKKIKKLQRKNKFIRSTHGDVDKRIPFTYFRQFGEY